MLLRMSQKIQILRETVVTTATYSPKKEVCGKERNFQLNFEFF